MNSGMSRKVKPIKLVYRLLYTCLFKFLPSSLFPVIGKLCKLLRAWAVRGFAEEVGKNVNIQRMAIVSSKLRIGEKSGIGAYSKISGPVIIGKYVNMGPECIIYTSNHRHDRTDITMQQQGLTEPKLVEIGDDVWIGARVIILPGVKIGNGCIIGAGAVVTHNIPDYTIACGVPARVVKKREMTGSYLFNCQREEN